MDAEGGDQALPEHLVLVVADQHHDIGGGLREHLRQGGDRGLAGVVPLLCDLRRQLRGKVLSRPFDGELVIGPGPLAVVVLRIAAVILGAQMPQVGRGGQHRPVR